MKLLPLISLAALLIAGPALAAEPAAPAAADTATRVTPAAAEPLREPGEPAVQNIVIEDAGSRVEELRVRGQTQRIQVTTTQGGTHSSYQVLVGDGSREAFTGRGAIGQRVWSVLSF